jgi:hypothetical protein
MDFRQSHVCETARTDSGYASLGVFACDTVNHFGSIIPQIWPYSCFSDMVAE